MTSAQVQRTLVKSPPELWAELSDPAALARHLGELGEIRITRVEPEHRVEWTAEHASGTVQIKPSAWGTRVTLTASREQSGDPPTSPTEAPSLLTSVQLTPPEVAPGPPLSRAQPALEATLPPAAPSAERPITGAGPLIVAAEPAIAAERDPATGAGDQAPIAAERDPAIQAGDQAPIAAERDPAITATRDASSAATHLPPAAAGLDPAGASTHAPAAHEPIAPERALERGSAALEPAADSRRGCFARLLRRFRRAEPAGASTHANHPPEQEAALAAPEPLSLTARGQSPALDRPEDQSSEPPAGKPHLAARAPEPSPEAAPAQMVQKATDKPPSREPHAPQREGAPAPTASGEAPADEVTTVLNAVLDRLGAAHHRPFSRA